MKKDYKDFIIKILEELKDYNYINSKDIPNIDLYMDQVTTFMDEHLNILKRNPSDKTLTKTMINNYSKFNLLPPTIKKKYSKEHIILLIFIYYLKHTLSITDIHKILNPLQKISDDNISLEQIYDSLQNEQINCLDTYIENILKTVDVSNVLFENVSAENENDQLSIIGTIFLLNFQASIQKHIAAKLIDEYFSDEQNIKNNKKEKKSKDQN